MVGGAIRVQVCHSSRNTKKDENAGKAKPNQKHILFYLNPFS